MKLIVEVSEREKEVVREIGNDIKGVFQKIVDSFEVKVVKNRR